MSKAEQRNSNRLYLTITQGSLRQSVPEGTKDAVRRDWEAGGQKGVKWEIPYSAYSGKITNVYFYDGEKDGRKYTTLNIVLDENEEGKEPVITAGIATRYASDILKKLPSIDFTKEIRLRPYAFKPEDEDKTLTGVEIMQPDRIGNFTYKVDSHFHAKGPDGKTIVKNGFPVPEGDTRQYTTDDWDIFYKQVRRFLVNYTKEHICMRFEEQTSKRQTDEGAEEAPPSGIDYPKDEISADDIPF